MKAFMSQEPPRYIAHTRKQDGMDQPLEAHLNEVGELAGKLAEKFGVAETGQLIGLLHDYGKYSHYE